MKQPAFDVLVIGSGAAGLGIALRLATRLRIGVLSKKELKEGNTYYAQGGVSAVLDDTDSFTAHIEDTLKTGAGLCDEQVVRFTVENGPTAIDWLAQHGVAFSRFTKSSGRQVYHLTREGGHSHRRVVHEADRTGRTIATTLIDLARAHRHISILEHHVAIDLITNRRIGESAPRVLGAWAFDARTQRVVTLSARFVILASGGASKAYLYTSNPDIATGDGIAMAWRAGCRVANLEFIQFHPTCLFHPHAKSFLISEALRGEGAVLRLPNGERFMPNFDERAELAPRDVVARAIDHEMKRLGLDCVFLDISHKPAAFITRHFPTIHTQCLTFGIDITAQPIPVVPAAHYTCGGVMVNRHGHTDLPNLYAIGETAHTGLHGANRMASNSLLECMVYAAAAGDDISRRIHDTPHTGPLPDWDESQVTDSDEEVVIAHNWDELRRFMWDYVGIVRSTKRLERAQHRVATLQREIDDYYANFRVTNDLLELRNLTQVAALIIRSALSRRESRGLHFTLDYPKPNTASPPHNTVLVPRNLAQRTRTPFW